VLSLRISLILRWTRNSVSIEYVLWGGLLPRAFDAMRCNAIRVTFIDFSVCVCDVCYLSSTAKEYNRHISVEGVALHSEVDFCG